MPYLPASHIERLIWSFLRDNIFGGVKFFFKKETILFTVHVILVGALYYYSLINLSILLLQAIFLIAIGLVCRNKYIGFKASLIIFLSLNILNILSILKYFIAPIESYYFNTISINYVILALVFFWTLFGATFFVLQLAEFFSSTFGILLFWGSDKKRLLFTPIPQLAIVLSLSVVIYHFLVTQNILILVIYAFPILLTIVLIYGLFSSHGRIIRNTIAFYFLVQSFYIISSLTRAGFTQATVFNTLLTILALLFMIQTQTRRIVTTSTSEKERISYIILIVYGTLIIFSTLLARRYGNSMNFELTTMWQLNTLASALALIIALIYLTRKKKISQMINRDNFTAKTLFLEMGILLGQKFVEELTRGYTAIAIELQKKTKEIKEKITRNTYKNLSDLAKFMRERIEKWFKKKK